MQGVEPAERELWDAAQVVGHLVPVGSMFGFLAGHRLSLLDEGFAPSSLVYWRRRIARRSGRIGSTTRSGG